MSEREREIVGVQAVPGEEWRWVGRDCRTCVHYRERTVAGDNKCVRFGEGDYRDARSERRVVAGVPDLCGPAGLRWSPREGAEDRPDWFRERRERVAADIFARKISGYAVLPDVARVSDMARFAVTAADLFGRELDRPVPAVERISDAEAEAGKTTEGTENTERGERKSMTDEICTMADAEPEEEEAAEAEAGKTTEGTESTESARFAEALSVIRELNDAADPWTSQIDRDQRVRSACRRARDFLRAAAKAEVGRLAEEDEGWARRAQGVGLEEKASEGGTTTEGTESTENAEAPGALIALQKKEAECIKDIIDAVLRENLAYYAADEDASARLICQAFANNLFDAFGIDRFEESESGEVGS